MRKADVSKHEFETGEVSRLSRVPFSNLNYWVKTGFIRPSYRDATGTGTGNRRKWSFRDVIACRVAGDLRKAGVSLQACRMVVAHLVEGDDAPDLTDARVLASARLVVDEEGDVLRVRAEEVGPLVESLLKKPGQVRLPAIINLEHVAREVRRDAEVILRAA